MARMGCDGGRTSAVFPVIALQDSRLGIMEAVRPHMGTTTAQPQARASARSTLAVREARGCKRGAEKGTTFSSHTSHVNPVTQLLALVRLKVKSLRGSLCPGVEVGRCYVTCNEAFASSSLIS